MQLRPRIPAIFHLWLRIDAEVSDDDGDVVDHPLLGLPPLHRLLGEVVGGTVCVLALVEIVRHHDMHDLFV